MRGAQSAPRRLLCLKRRASLNTGFFRPGSILDSPGLQFPHGAITTAVMSDQPVIAAKAPAKVSLEAGKDYWFCTCGKSATQPFCNGSHKGSSFAPKKFTAEKSGDAWLCQCKHTANAPFCDGTHKTLGA
jgi:CDGSH-type Zn-finger protein